MLKKQIVLVIGLLLFSTLAFAEVYTEGVSYQIEVLEDGHLQVRKATRVYKDGVEIAKTYHRHALVPGANTINEVKKVKDIANVVWTPGVIAEYLLNKAK